MAENNKPLKVCVVMGSHWEAVMGGAQYQAKCIVEQLLECAGFDVYYLARTINNSYVPKGYKVIQIAENKGIRKYGYILDVFRLNRILDQIKPNIIYQRGLKSYTGILAYYAKRNDCKFIFHVAHDYDVMPNRSISIHALLQPIEKAVGEYGIKNANRVVVQTDQQYKYLKENYNRDDGVIIQNFHPKPVEQIKKQDSPVRVVWVANFKPIKRPELFVRLARDLGNIKNVEYVMVGRRGSEKLYKSLHEEISKAENIKYLGEQNINQVNKILAESHLFVNTSVAEGFPNTFIQAWMRQVPVVSVSVHADGVLDDNCIGVFGRSYEGMRDAVKMLIKKKGLRVKMGKTAQDYAYANHSLDNVSKLISLMN